MLRQDYVLRAIDELAKAIAAALGLRNREPEQALDAIEGAKRCLPMVPGVMDQLSPADLVRLLVDPRLIEQVANLYQHEAETRYVLGDHARAVRCAQRAQALRAAPPNADARRT